MNCLGQVRPLAAEMNIETNVLVTDGETRAALALTRSLVRAGCRVHVVARDRYSLAAVSRGVTPFRLLPHPLSLPREYVEQLAAIIQQRGINVLLPITDASLEAILELRDILPPVTLPVPELSAYHLASDKCRILSLAKESGLEVPETLVISSAEEAAEPPPPGFFPAVLKPHKSLVRTLNGREKVAVTIIGNRGEYECAVQALAPDAFPVLVQRRVSGPAEGLFLARWDGRLVAAFAHRRLREKPPSGGVSTCCESIPLQPVLLEAGRRLLDRLNWQGVAMIECKRDSETGKHVLMEINGRFWGSLQLAIDAGVDFPRILLDSAMGRDVTPVFQYRQGIRSRWLWGELDHLALRMVRSNGRLRLDPAAPSRFRTLLDFLAFKPGRDHCSVFSLSDPMPFLAETLARFKLKEP